MWNFKPLLGAIFFTVLETVDETTDWRRCTAGWTLDGGFDLSTACWMVIIISMVDSSASWWSRTSSTLKSTVMRCSVF